MAFCLLNHCKYISFRPYMSNILKTEPTNVSQIAEIIGNASKNFLIILAELKTISVLSLHLSNNERSLI